MTDLETILRQTLRDELDPVGADPGRAGALTHRARRARLLRAAAATLATAAVLAAAVATSGAGRDDERELRPAAPPQTFAVFAATSPEGKSWRVAVDAEQAQVCYAAEILGAGSVHLHKAGAPPGTVAKFGEGIRSSPSRLCTLVDPAAAETLIAEPELHYLEFHSLGALGDSLSAALEPRPTAELPDVAEIVCGAEGAVAMTPEIRPQRDGIHLAIYNYGRPTGEFYLVDPDGGNEIGNLPADDVRENVSGFGPGPLQIGCTDYAGRFSYDGTGSRRHAELTVVDPDGLWTDPELECGDGRRRRTIDTDRPATEAPGVQPPAESLIREFVPGVEPDDVVERPRYPGSNFKLETRTLVRDGRRIARFYLGRKDSMWSVIPYVCPGAGIADWEDG